jgi:ABC-type sugar transport system ATPase subunit
MNGTARLEMHAITKAFGHVQALDDVSIELDRGEVLGLVGDNGAGKSTLIKILSGVYRQDVGEIVIDGVPRRFASPADAAAAGVATVYQDLALVDTRDVAANIFLGREFRQGPFIDVRRGRIEAAKVLRQLAAEVPSVRTAVGMLSGGQRQAVAIARAIVQGGQIIILDEPTAALGVAESERVLVLAEELRASGNSVILISHNLEHVMRASDRIAVLYKGRLVRTVRRAETTIQGLVHMIVAGGLEVGST